MANSLDLFQLFQGVTGQLQQNKDQLNQADEYNHDHGDNMVDTFEVITQAMRERQGADPADQLAYASEILRQRKSGSSQLYAKGLYQASQDFKGQQITQNNAVNFIQTLLGGGQPVPQQQQGADIGGLLGSLLGGSQQQSQPQQSSGLDMGDLLQAGMAFMSTKSRGGSNLEAIVNAVVANSAMGSGYRSQSSSLVTNAMMSVLKGMLGK
jgi:hypothetical protein